MTDEQLESIADELGDIQTAIAYVLFRRSRPTLREVGETELLNKAAGRLQKAARLLRFNSTAALQLDSNPSADRPRPLAKV